MTRTRSFGHILRRQQVVKAAKGYYARRKNCYSVAVRAVMRSQQYAYISRRLLKRTMRALWIQRINAAARQLKTTYGHMMHNMAKSNILLNRKVLSELAIFEPQSFRALADFAKTRHEEGLRAIAQLDAERNPFVVHASGAPRDNPFIVRRPKK